MNERSQWGTRLGFLLAAMGSAIGLGNIWRFPAVAYENGGGAFFIPYLFALLTAGIPLLIMEYTIGHKYRGSAPRSLSGISKDFEGLLVASANFFCHFNLLRGHYRVGSHVCLLFIRTTMGRRYEWILNW